MISVAFISLMVTIRSISSLHRESSSTKQALGYWPSDMESALTCVSYCSLTFLCHFNLFSIGAELKAPSRKKIRSIVVVSMVTAFVIYMFVAIFGYIEVCDFIIFVTSFLEMI